MTAADIDALVDENIALHRRLRDGSGRPCMRPCSRVMRRWHKSAGVNARRRVEDRFDIRTNARWHLELFTGQGRAGRPEAV